MRLIKDKYQAFRQWQQQPFDYHYSNDNHRCSNCGKEIENNYCPRCGQKAVYGPISWHSVWQGIMDVWGMGSRSLPYTLWQLIWRPGYLIRDYISGKRQVSFPPVKMLVLVAVVLVLVNTLLGVNYNESETIAPSQGSDAYNALMDVFFEWMSNHIAWTVLMAFSFFIVPIWFLFRQAPRLPRHTLPQGFYVQVFIGVQFLVFMLLSIFLFRLFPDISDSGDDVMGFMVMLGLPIILLVDYKQLFGYGWWGTIWRVLVALPFALILGKMIIRLGGFGYSLYEHDWSTAMMYMSDTVGLLALIWLLIEIINFINTKSWRDSIHAKALWRLLLALAALLLMSAVSYQLGFKTPMELFLSMSDAVVLAE